MENIEIIILSTMVTTLFAIFIGFTIKELNNVTENKRPSSESGPRADMIKFVGRLFDSPSLTKEQADKKLDVYKTIYKTVANMESDGVYFSDDVKKELIKKREELYCEYSSLPSVKSYE
jgi:hypothetical protein